MSCVPLLGVVVVASFALPAATDPPSDALRERGLELHIIHPLAEAELDPEEPAFVAGEAFLRLPPSEGLDAVIVLDVSASTGTFAGADLDGDGRLDRRFAGGDSTLEAERRAAAKVLDDLPPRSTRVALVTYSGRDPRGSVGSPRHPAVLEQPLTSEPSVLRQRLDALARRVPAGMTDMSAGITLAERTIALAEASGRRDRVVLFFTDGAPTGPYLGTARNLQAALEAAERCRARDIRIHTFAIGAEALAHPEAAIRIADLTGGYFTPVEDPADLPDLASQVVRANVRRISVRNRSTGEAASDLVLDHDGSFSALVTLRPGANRIEVIATALGGLSARREVLVRARAGASTPPIPAALRSSRDAVLRERLARLLRHTEELKRELRRRLAREVERERQVKQLQLEVEGPPSP